MPHIGLFFGSSTGNCENIARMIAKGLHPIQVDIYDVMHSNSQKLNNYKCLIFGVPSWNRHHLQDDWCDFLPKIDNINFTDKKVAIYGLGDQANYPENFLDGMGPIFDWLSDRKATIVGKWPTVGYHFRKSKAIRNGKFVGLALDEDSQYDLSSSRITMWVENLKKEFDIKI
jgi:flavodoxin I